MASLDISDPNIAKYIKLVQDGNPSNRWVVFSYVPKSNNKIKFCDSGSGDLKELREELDDSSIRFAYIRFVINNMPKFVYIPWCGDGVNGPIKGAFSGHAIEFSKSFKPIHHQVNARSEEDIDEKAITAALNKATGASYDSGSKVQGAVKGTFIPQSVSQGREAATKSNAEVKNVINKNDYNKIQESAEYWKQNQAAKSDPAKPTRPEYNLSTERDDYWKQQQQEKQQQQQQQASRVNAPPPSRTIGSKFQEQVSKPTETAPPQPRPAPSKGSVLNRFPAATQQQEPPAPVPSRPAAPVPSRINKPVAPVQPVYEEPAYEEPQYEEQQYEEPQQQYEEQQYEQPTEEQQYYQEEPQHEQPTEEQQYYQEEQQYEQPTEEQQYYQEEQQQQYEQPTDDQQYYQEQQYEQPAEGQYDQSGYLQAKALYDYTGENEGDLSFREGDIIAILDQSDPDGWWQGSLPTGEQGFFPSNFVQQL